jgi:malonyl-CoA/methylmalonyl-CoA synthetase
MEGRLARYKSPKRVIFIAELPRNAMGKVQKAALRDAYKDLYAAPVAFVRTGAVGGA